MEPAQQPGCHTPYATDKSGRRNGDRLGRICRCHLQTRYFIHKYPHDTPFHGRCSRWRENRHQFQRFENEIGAFYPADQVLIDSEFLKTLDIQNLLSGYGEMLKHGLISNQAHWSELLNFDFNQIDYSKLQTLIGQSVKVKEDIVEKDPYEQNIRKALNFGHTIGHAFESFALKSEHPVLHGYAVAWGMVCELYLSHLRCGFPKEALRTTIQFIKENYGSLYFTCDDYDSLYDLMKHDKKMWHPV